jgi:tRNA pseudouridine55 synthase
LTTPVDGLVVVDKPAGMTSHDVVSRLRKRFGQKRVGHAGTLDPGATGVLLVGLGRATRLLRFLSDLGKSYEGEVVLGTATTTLDDEGEIVQQWPMAGVTLAEAREAAATLTGDILQVPPMVSAVKVGGRRLHELARAGVEVERAPRPVRVDRLELTPSRSGEPGHSAPEGDISVLRISVDCSSGTYVRVLAADLGTALGGGAHLRRLRRTRVGSFTLDEAGTIDDAPVLAPAVAVRDLPSVTVDVDAARLVSFGRPLPPEVAPDGLVAVLDAGGDLLAVYEDRRPSVVMAPA